MKRARRDLCRGDLNDSLPLALSLVAFKGWTAKQARLGGMPHGGISEAS